MFINIRSLLQVLTILVVAYILSVLVFFTLPKQGVEHEVRNVFQTKSNTSINLENIFLDKNTTRFSNTKAQRFLKTVKLLAIYDLGHEGGYIVIRESSSSKTHIIGKGESFKGYKLVKVLKKYALFEKQNKQYKLSLEFKKSGV